MKQPRAFKKEIKKPKNQDNFAESQDGPVLEVKETPTIEGFEADQESPSFKFKKAKKWVSENLIEDYYSMIEIQSKLYNNFGKVKSNKGMEKKADDMFWDLVLFEVIKWVPVKNLWEKI